MTVLTKGLVAHQAIASWARVAPRSFAIAAKIFVFASFAFPSSDSYIVRNHSYPERPMRLPWGIPWLYLPVKTPEAKGDQIAVPNPKFSYSGAYSISTRSR